MLAVTTDVTTDMVSMPLLWIIPLALYLITFIIVFSKSDPGLGPPLPSLMTPVAILLVVFLQDRRSNVDRASKLRVQRSSSTVGCRSRPSSWSP